MLGSAARCWPRRTFHPSVLTFAAPVVALGVAAWQRRWMSDDGYIYLRVVDQILAGHGPVFNHGERVEAATSPLWLWLLTLFAAVFRGVPTSWLAVGLGMLLSLVALALAQHAAYRWWTNERPRAVLPLGAVVIVALPPFWDFATSGLETGLEFAWLAACFWGLVRLYRDETRLAPWLLVLIGLGPLVRPDFAPFTLAFLVAGFAIAWPLRRADIARSVALAAALPLAYQVFRMGYYGALVPNPAFAKEASTSNWPQGWRYLVDGVRPYWLFVPVLLVYAAALPQLVARARDRRALIAIAAPVAGGMAHGLYVVYVGGDFMHGRMLLPAVFALLLPVAVVSVDLSLALVPAAGVAVWAVVCASILRPPYNGVGGQGIANERAYYVTLAQHGHPVTIQDYKLYLAAVRAFFDKAGLPPGQMLLKSNQDIAIRADLPVRGIVRTASLGVYGFIFGPDYHVVDIYGLAEPVGGRLELDARGRPGHEKALDEVWIIARFADPAATIPSGGPPLLLVGVARHALSCGDLQRLTDAVSAPMTPGRFAHNLVDAFRLHRFRVPVDPVEAEAELCGG